jgi:PAS domain S-box-containing protein
MSKPLRVLIVEDSEDDALLIARLLRAGDFEPTYERVDSAAALRAALSGKPWDFVISDHGLPNLDSLAALEIVREGGHELPFVIVSGVIGEESAVAAMKAGAHDYLMKGNLTRLVPVVERELAEAEVRRQRRRAELALRESNDRLRTIMDSVPDSIITIDEQGTIVSANRAAERMFGYSADELCGQNVKILMPDPDRGRHDGYIANYLRTGKSRILGIGPRELVGLCKNEMTFPLELAINEMQAGAKRMFIAVARDIARRKDAEAQLRQAQKMEAIGQLTGGIAHDFNNTLTVILGSLEFMGEQIHDNLPAQKAMETALRGVDRASDLTQRLLAFARKQALSPTPTDIDKLISGVAEMTRRVLGEQIQIEVVRAGGLWQAIIDPSQLETALLNLAINARDAMPEGGKLTIETANTHLDQAYADVHVEVTPGQYVMVAVSDTGTGMSPEVLVHAFEPFFTTKEVGKGSGLGLSMVYGFIKQSKGHINIYSEVEHGTSVKLYLPKATLSGRQVDTTTGARQAMAMGDETILVVEDDPDVRAFVVGALSVLGYEILEAKDGPAAMALLDDAPEIDLLFTDVVLSGGMNGREIAEKIRQRYPRVRVLFTSGYTSNAIVHHGRLDDNVRLLSKPYRREDLARRVREALDSEAP